MKTFSINTLGCKVNQYEGRQIQELLEHLGLVNIGLSQKPELVVVNTCCVTHTASAKSRQYIRKIHNISPESHIVVCGCLPTVNIGELNNIDKNVHLIRDRGCLAAELSRLTNNKVITPNPKNHQFCLDSNNIIKTKNCPKIKDKNELSKYLDLPPLNSFKGHTRAFLKIQDGCDGHCTYCIVPKTRPCVHSKSADIVLKEAKALVGAGHKEIVVTGVFLGAYGQDSVIRKNWPNQQNNNLADILDKMAEIPNLTRIRLSSLEPADVTPRLLDTFSKHRNIMPHLHLSLQSGSDAILKRMRRQYNADEYRGKIELIKDRLDRPAITTDIIVGFPGETDSDFKQTLNLAKDVGFAKIHVFSFSPRKGTAAARMQDSIDNRVIKERSILLHNLNTKLARNYRQQFIGETAEILLENDNGLLYGRCERYFKVYLPKPEQRLKKNDLVTARLTRNHRDGLIGQIVSIVE
ncbi:MAG: tRNA (N(6)-L-threonylcarbamoyladenosine(37)-C(2))-methylthiotransferase MtaB [Phycisphaerales bacterium]|jgi:threonylcarbamoyladenosine tRNA methylthiotransferase MtaB